MDAGEWAGNERIFGGSAKVLDFLGEIIDTFIPICRLNLERRTSWQMVSNQAKATVSNEKSRREKGACKGRGSCYTR